MISLRKIIKTIKGTLKYNDNGHYEIHTSKEKFNLSKLLDKIYYSPKSHYINLCIMKGCKVIFNEEGGLYKRIDSDGIISYHILGNNLEKKLFDNTENNLEFTLYVETMGGRDYEQFNKAL